MNSMKKKEFIRIVAVCICWSGLFPFSLWAQDAVQPLSLDDKRIAFREGVNLLEKKKYEKAYQQFLSLHNRYDELQDYVSYFLAFSLKQQGNDLEALAAFQEFLSQFPSHPLSDEVRFLVADILFESEKYAEALPLYQHVSKSSIGRTADVLYKLGVTLMYTQNTQKAVPILHTLVTTYPGSRHVKPAQAALRELLKSHPELTPVHTETTLLDYANALSRARLYSSAIKQYSFFQAQYPNSERIGESELGLAEAYFRLGQTTRGMKKLEETVAHYRESQPNVAAKALYTIGMKHWYADRNRQAKRVMQRIVKEFRATEWSDNAHYVLGRIYQSSRDYQAAAQWYASLYKRHAESSFAEEALWRAGWSWYIALHFPKAVEAFSQGIVISPDGEYAGESLYWKGRALERQTKNDAALTTYRQIMAAFPGNYYAIRTQDRLTVLQAAMENNQRSFQVSPEFQALLAEFSQTLPFRISQEIEPHIAKSIELHHVQHDAFAQKEVEWVRMLLERHFTNEPNAESQALSLYVLGRLYSHIRLYLPAIQLVPKIERILTTANIQGFPYNRKRLSYPLDYWELIRRYASSNQLDPFLVAGIIRQESAYNPTARSSANARGLMQILPTTGRRVAKQIGLKNFRTANLYDPETSIALGTAYLAGLIEQFDGDVFRAVAGYNAGPKATNKWWPAGGKADSEEITENITYRETRNYVKHVLRNQYNYRVIYGDLPNE